MSGSVALYARRLAHVPGALRLLRLHPDGLPIARVAEELEVPETQLREELEVFFLADVVDTGSVGLRSCALEFLASGPDGGLAEADLADAQVVRLTDDSPFDELGVAFLSASDLGVLYRAASELSALEPDNEVLAAAVARLGTSVLGGVEGRGGFMADVAADLRTAATQHRRVRITYARAWQPGVVERVVEPWRVVSTRRGYEVDAGPLDADGGLRTYLVSGVRAHEVLDETFARPADADDRIAAARREVPVRLVVPADRVWVAERFAESVTVEQSDADGVQVVAGVLPPVRDRVGLLLAVAGGGAFVVDPPDLRDTDRETARRLLEHHGLA
ncbi:helix-turn-helix transcriptional regulator [Aquipuribacter sp. MA13-6]|uniref:helix-turn-helix transcriptional regulator n=1 Tax=unclassified Aquipuribacter TaxID=2635084 RepID=UPI003EEA4554